MHHKQSHCLQLCCLNLPVLVPKAYYCCIRLDNSCCPLQGWVMTRPISNPASARVLSFSSAWRLGIKSCSLSSLFLGRVHHGSPNHCQFVWEQASQERGPLLEVCSPTDESGVLCHFFPGWVFYIPDHNSSQTCRAVYSAAFLNPGIPALSFLL